MSSGLQGKVALITGATGGVGPAVVAALGEDGATIVAASRSEAELAHLQAELGLPTDRWLGYPVDLTDPAATQGLVDASVARFGRVDILAAVAGGWRGGTTVATTEPATFEWLLRTNLINGIQRVSSGPARHAS